MQSLKTQTSSVKSPNSNWDTNPKAPAGRPASRAADPFADASPRDYAHRYRRAGLSVVPIRGDGTKTPACQSWKKYQTTAPTAAEVDGLWLADNVGIAVIHGKVSGTEVIDLDNGDLYQPFADEVERLAPGLFAKLTIVRTPRPGDHVAYKCETVEGSQKLAKRADGKTLIETKGEGGYTLAPGSPGCCHKMGGVYEHVGGPPLTELTTITPAERDILFRVARSFNELHEEETPATASKPKREFAGISPGDDFNARATWEEILTPHGWEHSHGKYWRRPGKEHGWSATVGCKSQYGTELFCCFTDNAHPLKGAAAGRPCTTYSKFALYAVLNHGGDFSAAARQLSADGYGARWSLTDAGNAERFAAQHGSDLRYCHPSKHWLFFDGQRWREDDCGEVMRRAKSTAKAIYREAEFAEGSDEQKAVAKWAQSSQHASRLHAMQSLAQSEPGIAILPNQLDADPWLLNCPNGTIDLRTGELGPHRSGDFITKTTGVEYPIHVASDPPLWRDFLEVIFSHDAELIAFVKRLLGYSLLGEVREHILPVFYGNGANGKSTLCEVVSEAMGDYALKAPAGFLMTTRGELHPTRLADLHGRRFVLISETGDGRKLDEPLVKELTGGDTIRARRMHQDYWQFKPSHTCALVTNYKPTIHGVDQGIWRRLRLVPFDVSIPREQQDTELGAKLRAELPQILRWLVQGCLEWNQIGLKEPAKVLMATEAYRVHSDSFSRWLAECCSVSPAATCKLSDAFDSYCQWGQTEEGVALSRPKFTERLQNHGFTKLPKRKDGIYFGGFDLSKGDAGDDGDATLLFLS